MRRGTLSLAMSVALMVACGNGSKSQTSCDPNVDENCDIIAKAGCRTNTDCGDGTCGADGVCIPPNPAQQNTSCAGMTCPADHFCSNGQCVLSGPQCAAADPACIYIPHGAFEQPAHEWWWPFNTPQGPDGTAGAFDYRKDLQYTDYVQVMSTPVVMRLHAGDTSPAVVFNTLTSNGGAGSGQFVESQGVMRAISGADGSPLWTAPKDMFNHMDQSVNANSNVAAGDCLGTGEVCFISGAWDPNDVPCNGSNDGSCNPNAAPGHPHEHGGIIAFGSDGRTLWVNRAAQVWWGAPAIARLLGPTGPAQLVVANGVYDGATGKTLCAQDNEFGAVGGNGDGALTTVADVDMDGIPEVVTGNQAYKLVADASSATGYTCKPLWATGVHMPRGETCPGGSGTLCPEGFPAVANFAGYGDKMGLATTDTHPQVVVISKGYLSIHDWTGGMLLSPIPIPQPAASGACEDTTYNPGGAPTIADFDGDGLPEVGVAGQSGYSVWKPGAGWIWTTPTYDCSANTGSSVFDFEGKGNATVVYSDQCYFHVYDGKTGNNLIEEQNSSCTAYEMPLVADVDGSGRARILVPNNNICQYVCPWGAQNTTSNYVGLKALKSPTDKWVNTRSVWNEHTYHVTNVNLDGTLPYPETQSWAAGQSNSFRQNVQGQGVFSSPDLSICEVTVDMTNCSTAAGATVTGVVYNGGAIPAQSGVTVDFYAEMPDGTEAHIGQSFTTKTLQPGDSQQVTVPWYQPPQSVSVQVKAVVDVGNVIGDCHPENNAVTTTNPSKCSPLG